MLSEKTSKESKLSGSAVTVQDFRALTGQNISKNDAAIFG